MRHRGAMMVGTGLASYAAAQAPATDLMVAPMSTNAGQRFTLRNPMSQGGMLVGTVSAGTSASALDSADTR